MALPSESPRLSPNPDPRSTYTSFRRGQQLASEDLALGGQATALIIGQSETPLAELLPQHTILLDKVGDDLRLLTVDPAGERREEKLQREKVGHHTR